MIGSVTLLGLLAQAASVAGTGAIAGVVRDALTGEPVAGATIYVCAAGCEPDCTTPWATSDVHGLYSTPLALPPGTYYAKASHSGHLAQVFDAQDCSGDCQVRHGSPIEVTDEQVVGVDFSLMPAGVISGTMTDTTGAYVGSGFNELLLFDEDGRPVRSGTTEGPRYDGRYVQAGVAPGRYYVGALVTQTPWGPTASVDQVYPGIPCRLRSCPCDVRTGTLVTIRPGEEKTGVDFRFEAGGQLSGSVAPREATDGSTWPTVTDASGCALRQAVPDASSNPYTSNGLTPGTYFVSYWPRDLGDSEWVRDGAFVGQLWLGEGQTRECPSWSCDPRQGKPITLAAGDVVGGIDFQVAHGGRISGSVDPDGTVEVFDSAGRLATRAYSSGGTFSTREILPSGSYFARASADGFVSQLYSGASCPGCPVTSGTPITVTAGQTTAGVGFRLDAGSFLAGRVSGGAGVPLAGVVEVFDGGGRLAATASTSRCSTGWRTGAVLPDGQYHVRASSAARPASHRPRLYGGPDCAVGCPVTAGTAVSLGDAGVDFELVPWTWKGDTSRDGRSDLVWRHADGAVYVWMMDGASVGGPPFAVGLVEPNWTLLAVADFNGDGAADLLWREAATGDAYVWFLDGRRLAGRGRIRGTAGPASTVEAVADFDGDGRSDLLWRHPNGTREAWLMAGTVARRKETVGAAADGWTVKGAGDLDGDGRSDLLWRDSASGVTYVWLMNGTTVAATGYTSAGADTSWSIAGIGDLDGDGRGDVLWRRTQGETAVWHMDGTSVERIGLLPGVGANWSLDRVLDFDGDWRSDLLWREAASGATYVWLMNGDTVEGSAFTSLQAGPAWATAGP